ncbi:MAG: CopG family transcriptional regulator [Acidimicrobiia bacterium]
MKRTQIYLDDDQDRRLRARARADGTTKSAVIREAIEAFLTRKSRRAEIEAHLEQTVGSIPRISVPSRDEWDRGHG